MNFEIGDIVQIIPGPHVLEHWHMQIAVVDSFDDDENDLIVITVMTGDDRRTQIWVGEGDLVHADSDEPNILIHSRLLKIIYESRHQLDCEHEHIEHYDNSPDDYWGDFQGMKCVDCGFKTGSLSEEVKDLVELKWKKMMEDANAKV